MKSKKGDTGRGRKHTQFIVQSPFKVLYENRSCFSMLEFGVLHSILLTDGYAYFRVVWSVRKYTFISRWLITPSAFLSIASNTPRTAHDAGDFDRFARPLLRPPFPPFLAVTMLSKRPIFAFRRAISSPDDSQVQNIS